LLLKEDCLELQKKEVDSKANTYSNLLEELASKEKDFNTREKNIKDKEVSLIAQDQELRIREGVIEESLRKEILKSKGINY
jgi:uncharacterized protein (DUF3084 family)